MNPPRPDPRAEESDRPGAITQPVMRLPMVTERDRELARAIVAEFTPLIRQEVVNGMAAFLERIVKLETRVETIEWQQGRISKTPSLPPMRNTMDTGRFETNLQVLERALADEKAAREAYERGKMQEQLTEFKESRKWWWQQSITWIVGGLGAVLSIVFAAMLTAYLTVKGFLK